MFIFLYIKVNFLLFLGYTYSGDNMSSLKKIRLKYGYTCDDMARKLNISKPYYWQIENGQRKLSYQMAVKISSIFKMKPDEIFYKEYK